MCSANYWISHIIGIEVLWNLIFSIVSKIFNIFHEATIGFSHSYSLGGLVEKVIRKNWTNAGTRLGNREMFSPEQWCLEDNHSHSTRECQGVFHQHGGSNTCWILHTHNSKWGLWNTCAMTVYSLAVRVCIKAKWHYFDLISETDWKQKHYSRNMKFVTYSFHPPILQLLIS